jgi:hypothetical protein
MDVAMLYFWDLSQTIPTLLSICAGNHCLFDFTVVAKKCFIETMPFFFCQLISKPSQGWHKMSIKNVLISNDILSKGLSNALVSNVGLFSEVCKAMLQFWNLSPA